MQQQRMKIDKKDDEEDDDKDNYEQEEEEEDSIKIEINADQIDLKNIEKE